jgi:hypothetical protein
MFWQLFSSAFLFHLIMKQYYPREYTSILIFLAEYGIFAYSFIELKTTKMYKQIKNNSSVNSLIEQMKSPNNIEIILNNQIVSYSNKESIFFKLPFENDFVIYSEQEPMTSRTNKMIVHNYSLATPDDVFKYKLCNYMFISTTLYLERRSLMVNYDLKLFCNEGNYFVTNNKIDKYVICYLLKEQKNLHFSPENCNYKLSIIDQNANMIELSENDLLYLYENNYEIIRANCETSENENEENENSGSSVGSKEYEIVENDNN